MTESTLSWKERAEKAEAERDAAVTDERPDKHRWQGPGPEPAWWYADDGTKVYRSYEDYSNG